MSGPAAIFAAAEDDGKIEAAIRNTFNYRTVLANKVDAKSKEGVVTLTGTVADRELKDLAEDTVITLPGVVSIKDDIVVVPISPERSDGWIAFKLRSTLLVKSNVSATSTTVDVANGVVTLGGTASNAAQKELTELYAKEIEGVTSVKNNMVVAENHAPRTVDEEVDDASITGQLKYQLASHKSTRALKTKIVTDHGVVVIAGEADSDDTRKFVTKLAESIRGVRSVDNRMTLRG